MVLYRSGPWLSGTVTLALYCISIQAGKQTGWAKYDHVEGPWEVTTGNIPDPGQTE